MPRNKQFDEQEALAKARDVFWKKGYNGTSMDELVKATGLSRSSLYDSFGDKHAIYMKSLAHFQQSQTACVQKEIADARSGLEKIETFFESTIQSSIEDKQRKGCFILNSMLEMGNVDRPIGRLTCSSMESIQGMLRQWVAEGQKQGEITKKHSAGDLAAYLYSALNGVKVMGQVQPEKERLEKIIQIVLNSIRTKPSS